MTFGVVLLMVFGSWPLPTVTRRPVGVCPPAHPCIQNQTNPASSSVVIDTRHVGPSMWLSGLLRRARGCVSWRWCDTVWCLFRDTFIFSLWAARILEMRCRHFDEMLITGCTSGAANDQNQNNNFSVAVTDETVIPIFPEVHWNQRVVMLPFSSMTTQWGCRNYIPQLNNVYENMLCISLIMSPIRN